MRAGVVGFGGLRGLRLRGVGIFWDFGRVTGSGRCCVVGVNFVVGWGLIFVESNWWRGHVGACGTKCSPQRTRRAQREDREMNWVASRARINLLAKADQIDGAVAATNQ